MKSLLLFLNFLISVYSFSQVLNSDKGTTRAVVIGISDYQNEQITDLKYAHRDAEAFVAWLRSPSGGEVKAENIKLLINKKATVGQIVSEMYWLVEESKPGDKAYIYFSGHGDVEKITKFQRGYLLTYDSPPSNYMAGAFPVNGLKDIITTLSDNNTQIIMVSDACRAGKLAGSGVGGAQATSAIIKERFANEIKILSCQPNEFSLEGTQWGGGRGCFSYHLMDGLYGLADKDEDFKITLLELERYLEDHVSPETAPHPQMPIIDGSKGSTLAFVNESVLADLKKQKDALNPTFARIESKGINNLVKELADSTIKVLYQEFLAAIERGDLMEPAGKSADDYYRILSNEPSLEKLYGFMRRNFAAALQDESQIAINAYLSLADEELVDMSRGDTKYHLFASYLERASELMGPGHYIYNFLKAKQLYFEALDIRVRKTDRTDSSADSFFIWREWRQEKLLKALEFEESAAFIHNEMGMDFGMDGIPYFEKAIELAPQWAIPYMNVSVELKKVAKLKEAESYALKAIELAPTSGLVYNMLGRNYDAQQRFDEAGKMFEKAVELSPGHISYAHRLGIYYKDVKRFKEAEEIFLKTLEKSPGHMRMYESTSDLYLSKTLEYDKAVLINRRKLEIRPTDGDAFCNLVEAYTNSGEKDKIRDLIEEMKQLDNSIENWEGKVCIGYAYQCLGEYDPAIEYMQNAIEKAPDGKWLYFRLAWAYHDLKDYDAFLATLKTSLTKGMYYNDLGSRFYFRPIAKTKGFKEFAQMVTEKVYLQGFGSCLMGLYYDSRFDFEKAATYYEKAVELSPEREKNWLNYAESAYLSGNIEKADSLFRIFLDVSAENALSYIQIGQFYRLHSEYQLAEKYLQQALKLSPDRREAYWNLAWVLFSDSKQNEAQDLLDQGVSMQSTDDKKAVLLYAKGLLFYYAGQSKESLVWLRKAAKFNEKYLPLAKAIDRLIQNNSTETMKYFEEAIKMNPADDNLRYMFAGLNAESGNTEKALELLGKVINKGSCLITDNSLYFGGRTYDFINNDPKLESLRSNPEYMSIMKLYFPEKENQ